jgi:hypothetical protein
MEATIVIFCDDCCRPFDAEKRNRVPETCEDCRREANRLYLKRRREGNHATQSPAHGVA